jgi:pimeloyl-ACP methyl ester carboxylesterase
MEMFWMYGYVKPLKKKYQLILIDFRGHGASDKPHDPEAYRTKTLVADIVAVLDKLKVDKAHFLGYSMGGGYCFSIAKYAPERVYSMIIGGCHPYPPNAEEQAGLERWLQLLKKGKDVYVADIEESDRTAIAGMTPRVRAARKAMFMANDTEALAAFISSEDYTLSSEEVLPTMSMPCLVYAGENDWGYSRVKKCAQSMPNATFVSLPNLDHVGAALHSSIILPHITKFLEKASQT